MVKCGELILNSRISHGTRNSHTIPNPIRVSNHLPSFLPHLVLHERVDRRQLLIWISNLKFEEWTNDEFKLMRLCTNFNHTYNVRNDVCTHGRGQPISHNSVRVQTVQGRPTNILFYC